MIQNLSEIISQNLKESERILMEFIDEVGKLDESNTFTVNSMEKALGNMISNFINYSLKMAGKILSNIKVNEIEKHCKCGKKLRVSKRDAETNILSIYGNIPVRRDLLFCRSCHKGYGVTDKMLEVYDYHRLTKGMTELITYVAQLMPFKEASQTKIETFLFALQAAIGLGIVCYYFGYLKGKSRKDPSEKS